MVLVEIFKTNVTDHISANYVIHELRNIIPESKVNFDLEDCDNILRIESKLPIDISKVSFHLNQMGFYATIIE